MWNAEVHRLEESIISPYPVFSSVWFVDDLSVEDTFKYSCSSCTDLQILHVVAGITISK